jgi:hypothetical protein
VARIVWAQAVRSPFHLRPRRSATGSIPPSLRIVQEAGGASLQPRPASSPRMRRQPRPRRRRHFQRHHRRVGRDLGANRRARVRHQAGTNGPAVARQPQPVGLDHWVWPGRTSRLGSSLSDHFGRVPVRSLFARLPDDAGAAPGVQGRRALWFCGTRTRSCAVRSAGSVTSRATGCGWQHCRDWFPAAGGARCSL